VAIGGQPGDGEPAAWFSCGEGLKGRCGVPIAGRGAERDTTDGVCKFERRQKRAGGAGVGGGSKMKEVGLHCIGDMEAGVGRSGDPLEEVGQGESIELEGGWGIVSECKSWKGGWG
jgi:hypothetical protein